MVLLFEEAVDFSAIKERFPMAARSVQCQLSNQTDAPFTYVSDHHNHGDFTDPWYPPAVIAPGEIGEWRTESGGFMTGTEGHVRYSTVVRDADGGHVEFIEAHWDNPFIGGNNSDISVVEDFTGKPSKTLKHASYIQGEPPPNLVKMLEGDVEAWIDGVLFPLYIFANAPIYNDAKAFYGVRSGGSPEFLGNFPAPETGKKSIKLNTRAKPAEWAGRWASRDVSVTLVSVTETVKAAIGSKPMTAYITDRSMNPPLQFQQDFALGGMTWVADHMLVNAIGTQFAGGSEPVAHALRASTNAVVANLYNAKGETPTKDQFQKTAMSVASEAGINLSTSRLDKAAKAITAFVEHSRGKIALMNSVYLSLYDEFTGGKATGSLMKYERHGVLGSVDYSANLDYIPDVR
jgi:hypothetical protein